VPEMRFSIRWPDGVVERCYSPSRAIQEFFAPGQSYPLADFVERSRTALNIAGDRVEAKYGYRCSRAAAQLKRIEAAAETFADLPGARVILDAFET
jgi:uncharacterized repeat protein (TIGR04042 family)